MILIDFGTPFESFLGPDRSNDIVFSGLVSRSLFAWIFNGILDS